jgi:uncharacterized protein (TIGR00730 family)
MIALTSLCVYCGSSTGTDPAHRAAAERLGRLMAEHGVRLVFGGGRIGLMGVLADAVLAAGGHVTGIIPGHIEEREVGHQQVTELLIVDNMHERKHKMFELADAFAVLPGGLGTLDETFEIITWRQLGLHDKPVVLIDSAGYWKPLEDLLEHVIAGGFANGSVRRLFQFVDSVDEVFDVLAKTPPPATPSQGELI